MARGKTVCCGLSTLEVTLMVLFVVMTAVSVGLISVMAVHWEDRLQEPEPTVSPTAGPHENPYLIGVGRADCTGPPGDVPLMGYANLEQTAAGIHTRLFSRAFIVDNGSKRVVFVTADIGMVSQRLRLESIAIAHRNIKPGRIYMSKGELEESNLNRSPHSYLNNPAEERNKYKSNTDKQVTLLKFTDLDGDGMGMLSWFAVHAVSMNYTNQMVSSDNMGYASYLLEQEKNIGFLPGEGPFVAAFASSNLGDASPNIRGPFCANTGLPCDYLNSSCPIGGLKMCVALGPAGSDMFNNTKIIGENIFKRAKDLYGKARQEVRGPLHAAHQWVNMTDVTVQLNSTHTGRTCKPALGHSFAAGTTDGGGDLNFTQGAVEGDPFWDGIRDALLGAPSNETQDCHQPKPILFSTGEMTWPLPWHPSIVDVQMITIGPVAIVAIPGEMTTMSGRRIREAVKQELEAQGTFSNAEVVVAGLCNIYTHYITTYEEYQIQRYEGASTIYGPHTLSAYIQKFRGLAKAIAEGKEQELPKGPEPPFFKDSQLFSLLPAAAVDKKPINTTFGEVLEQVDPEYTVGDVASVTFVAGNPRHSGDMRDKTFVTVEKYHNSTAYWDVVHTDASWETRFHWVKNGAESNATIEWHIPLSTQAGSYRIRHFGHYKQRKGFLETVIMAYEGVSDVFRVSKITYNY
ncbi:neutral ceramidase isoform X3 [Salvelinus fontinalis]|uniref:neutral ceramidase isoform X3 n=1 Tax=Salvelinus fontinalis TaxID=8038 RepID=UPI002485D79B|nr:neutral ceramidase isoform X3 [Salvelinus fontinalis]